MEQQTILHHILLNSYVPVSRACFITMPNGRKVEVKHIGTVLLFGNIILRDVLHVPEFRFNLLSASKLAKHLSSCIVFTPDTCYIQDLLKSKQQVLGREKDGLYLVDSTEMA